MAKFNRKIEREKSEFQFTQKPVVKPSRFGEFKANFGLRWINFNIRTVLFIIADYFAVSIIFVPLLMQYYDASTALVLAHGILTSLLIVFTFYIIEENKPPLSALFVRYCFMALLLGVASFVAAMVVL